MDKQLKDEEWNEVEGFEGIYDISNCGRIRVRDRLISCDKWEFIRKGRIMKPTPSGRDYLAVNLTNGLIKKRDYVHIMVAKAFVQNPDNKPQVNHKDGDKSNNHYTNLEWATSQENINHAFENNLNKHVQKNDKHRSKPVLQLSPNMEIIKRFPSISQVNRDLGFRVPNIVKAIKDQIQSHGYFWAYAIDATKLNNNG